MSGELDEPCPACGAAPRKPCTTYIDGVDTGWDHDARILAPVIRDLSSTTDPREQR